MSTWEIVSEETRGVIKHMLADQITSNSVICDIREYGSIAYTMARMPVGIHDGSGRGYLVQRVYVCPWYPSVDWIDSPTIWQRQKAWNDLALLSHGRFLSSNDVVDELFTEFIAFTHPAKKTRLDALQFDDAHVESQQEMMSGIQMAVSDGLPEMYATIRNAIASAFIVPRAITIPKGMTAREAILRVLSTPWADISDDLLTPFDQSDSQSKTFS